ncbi:MAG: radical SAM protein [Candidatus Altiarchaeota archaeon]
MRVLLLNPPAKGGQSRDGRCQTEGSAWLSSFPPTTLAGIAGCVRERHQIKLMDCIGSAMGYYEAMAQALEYEPDFVVVNTSTQTLEADLEIAGRIRDTTGAKIIAYGESVTARRAELVADGSVDFAVLGEPETPVMKILGGSPSVTGVAFRGWDGGLWSEPDLDTLPFPAYDLLPVYLYPLTGERWMFVRTGRGCPYKCVFCIQPSYSNKPRVHSVDYIVRQLKWLRGLGINVFMFWEETATLNRPHVLGMCDRFVREGLDKSCKWFATTRVDRFDDELAEAMSKAGCRMLAFGIESGCQEILDVNGKGITLEESKSAVSSARRHGIVTVGHFIIGLPGDTPKRARQTVKFACDLKLDFAQFYVATPFLGSEFHKIASDNGWIVEADTRNIQQGIAAVSYPDFSADQMQAERRRAFMKFYLRPHAIYASLKARSMQSILRLPLQALAFSRWALK